ncbi:hypothetical protein B0H11DRAFT_2111599 [Mycena galericulata]|nr:hypothetical protein B0H11DRAFT_2111599 [Mycena galericulata]
MLSMSVLSRVWASLLLVPQQRAITFHITMTNGRLGKRNVRFSPSVVLILLSDMARMRPTGTYTSTTINFSSVWTNIDGTKPPILA